MQLKWLDDFKIAIIEKNFEKIELLLEDIPDIKSINDLKTSVALINEAKKLLKSEQLKLRENMEKVKKSKKFFSLYYEEEKFSKSC